MKLLPLADALENRREHGFFDDFHWYISPHLWTSLVADAGSSAAAGDAAGGVLALTTGATDNNEVAVRTTAEVFKFAADKPLLYEARLQYAEAAVDDANVMAGFMDAVGANAMLDDGGGPKASFSGAVIYKVDGGAVWRFRTSVGAVNTDSVSRHAAGGSVAQVLRVEVREAGGVLEAVPFLDGQQMLDANNRPIKHAFAPGAATEMHAFAYAKAGGATSEVVSVDYQAAYQLR